MRSSIRYSTTTLLTSVLILGCGIIDKKDAPPPVEYVKLSVITPESDEALPVVITQASCTSDADTGFFSGRFTGSDGALLVVKVKGFSTSAASYECTQASDNVDNGVGNKFDGCTVALALPDAETSVNTYAMHREVETTKAFTYGGNCSLTMSYEEPRVTGSIDCTGLVQTGLQGSPRNPIDESVTADIQMGSTFFCDL